MPVITIEMGQTNQEKKKELIEKLTETASEITGIPKSSFIVFIREYPRDAIGVAGVPLSEKP